MTRVDATTAQAEQISLLRKILDSEHAGIRDRAAEAFGVPETCLGGWGRPE